MPTCKFKNIYGQIQTQKYSRSIADSKNIFDQRMCSDLKNL